MKIIDVLGSPWAIVPPKLLEIQAIYAARLHGEKADVAAIEAALGRPLQNDPQGYEVRDGVAIIPVDGVISKRMNLFSQISGGASTELIGRDIRAALADPAVHALILRVDSPGGTVDGTQELAQLVYGARGGKPIVTYVDGMMASAAYWIGSAADKAYIGSDTAVVGSIGVVASHTDYSRYEEKLGLKTTEIYAGKYKRIASEHQPLSEDGRQYMQDMVDYLYSVFVADVAKQRGTDADTVIKNMADGRIFTGLQAVRAGLVDGVSTLDSLIAMYGTGGSAGTSNKDAETKLNLDFQKLEKAMAKDKASGELTDENIKREWNSDPDIRAEFCDNFATYAAYRKAEARGIVSVHGAPVKRARHS